MLDYESRFREAVIDRFAESYAAGETPVPCIECNQSIKFRDLLGTARELGAQALATGHYVAVARLPGGGRALYRAPRPTATRAISCSPPRANSSISCAFRSAACPRPRRASSRARFGLRVADKQDSQDICFVPTGRYADMIERLKPGAAVPGEIVDLAGKRARPPRRHHQFHRRPAAAASVSPCRSRSMWCGSMPEPRRVVVGPRAALATRMIRLRM